MTIYKCLMEIIVVVILTEKDAKYLTDLPTILSLPESPASDNHRSRIMKTDKKSKTFGLS